MEKHFVNKQFNNKKKAFTLIELLIVIAIIGILFIVLVSKVDFATDKAKATGVQTDFRAFQTAFEQVARENSGYATLGWDTGDLDGDRLRNSYDKGDKECGQSGCTECKQDGKQGPHEIWVGSKTYGETWSGIYSLVNPADNKDASAFVALENVINSNLDPKLHITITPNADASGNLTGSAVITMANQARDPWKNEYAGAYITNATVDSLDRGSIIMYSKGANGNLGVNYSVSGGLVGVEAPGNNVNGKDDYVLAVTYSYANGYGEVQTGTAGFSNTQSTLTSHPIVDNGVNAGGMSAGTGSVPGDNISPLPDYSLNIQLPDGSTIIIPSDENMVVEKIENDLVILETQNPTDPTVDIKDVVNVFNMDVYEIIPSTSGTPATYVDIPYEISCSEIIQPDYCCENYFLFGNYSTDEDALAAFLNGDWYYGDYVVMRQATVTAYDILPDGTKIPTDVRQVHIEHSIASSCTLEDAIYLAAYLSKTFPKYASEYMFAVWNGNNYEITEEYDAQITNTDYKIRTWTETRYEQVLIESTISVDYNRNILGSIQFEEGMTWNEWLTSNYNIYSDNAKLSILDENLNAVDLNSVIDLTTQYNFAMLTLNGEWMFNEVIELISTGQIFEEVNIYYPERNATYSSFVVKNNMAGAFLSPLTYSNGTWNPDGRHIDFVNEQYVSFEFYTWFIANATKL